MKVNLSKDVSRWIENGRERAQPSPQTRTCERGLKCKGIHPIAKSEATGNGVNNLVT
jgi:hypothetical protein